MQEKAEKLGRTKLCRASFHLSPFFSTFILRQLQQSLFTLDANAAHQKRTLHMRTSLFTMTGLRTLPLTILHTMDVRYPILSCGGSHDPRDASFPRRAKLREMTLHRDKHNYQIQSLRRQRKILPLRVTQYQKGVVNRVINPIYLYVNEF